MQLTGPQPVTFVPAATTITVDAVTFNLNAHTYTIVYRDPNALGQKSISGAIPGALLTALETEVQRVIEANENWANGSSSVVAT